MIGVQDWLPVSGLEAQMIMQVHDELVFEVAQTDVEALNAGVVERMAGAASLSVPLVVDTGVRTTGIRHTEQDLRTGFLDRVRRDEVNRLVRCPPESSANRAIARSARALPSPRVAEKGLEGGGDMIGVTLLQTRQSLFCAPKLICPLC